MSLRKMPSPSEGEKQDLFLKNPLYHSFRNLMVPNGVLLIDILHKMPLLSGPLSDKKR